MGLRAWLDAAEGSQAVPSFLASAVEHSVSFFSIYRSKMIQLQQTARAKYMLLLGPDSKFLLAIWPNDSSL